MFIRAQAQYDFAYKSMGPVELQLSRTLFRNGRLKVNLGYNCANETFSTEVGFTMDLKSIRSTTTFNSVGSSVAFRESLNGSLGVDARNGKIDLSNREQVGRSAVSVVSYVDNNTTGVFDKGDEIMPYNSVTLDNPVTAKVGGDGVLRLSQLQSYYRYNLRVNRNAISDPTLVPLLTEFSFVTDPNQYKRIEIPFYRGGTVDGKVLIDKATGPVPQGGLRLLIKGAGSTYEQTIRTFADGGFYMMDIPPGNYTIEVDKAQLDFLMVTYPPGVLKFSISASAEGDYVQGLQIHLVPDAGTEEKDGK
jgi:hypothetical protein